MTRQTFSTFLRALACGGVVLGLAGRYAFSLNLITVLGLAVLAALFAVYELSLRDAPPGAIAATVLTILAVMLISFGIWLWLQPSPSQGPLVAANDPAPPARCAGPGWRILAGSETAAMDGDGRASPLAHCPVLALTRNAAGLHIDETGYDSEGDIAFFIKDGIFEARKPNRLSVSRPDPGTFVLKDRFDREVLYVRYLNPAMVRVRGRFLCGDGTARLVADDATRMGVPDGIGGIAARGAMAPACEKLRK